MKSKKKKKFSFKNKGFSAFFLIAVVAFAIFLAGTFETLQTFSPTQGILDPNNLFNNPADKKSLQLRTLGFITPTTAPTLCQAGGTNDEPQIIAGYAPANGQSVSTSGQIKVWVNDEGSPIIAQNEQVDPTTGAVTTPGDRTAKAADGYLWEPALYISPQTLEGGGTPNFPNFIKGNYNNSANRGILGQRDPGSFVPGMDPVPGNPLLIEQYTAEYIWNVSALGNPDPLKPGNYNAEFVIHDGDVNLGVGCISITIQ